MKRAIVTGATGFVGANLTRRLIDDGHDVHLLVRREHDDWRIGGIRKDVRLHEVNLDDPETLEVTVRNIRPDWVFHLATHGAYSWQTDLRRIMRTNITGTINLVEACLRVGFEAFVNTGSSSEYGIKDHAPSESEELKPNSYYAVSKASATMFCRYVAQSRGVNIITLRPYSVYGPYEDPHRLMPTIILYGLEGRLPPLVSPDTPRDYVYVDDLTEAYLLAAGRPHQDTDAVYNVGTGTQTLLREVVNVARRALAIEAEPKWGSFPNRHWDTDTWVSDNRLIWTELGWRPRYTFEEGFRMMANWFRSNPVLPDLYKKLLKT
jgi:UDP-glucose 4-epimerase